MRRWSLAPGGRALQAPDPVEIVEAIVELRERALWKATTAGAADDRLPPRPRDAMGAGAVRLDDLADPQTGGIGRPAATEAAPQQPDPLPGRPAERDVADRHHPLAARRSASTRDPEHDRRPLAAVPRLARRSRRSKPRTSWTSSNGQSSCTACPPRCSPTTARCSRAHLASGKVLLQTELERLGISVQELPPLPPPDLRQDRAPTPNTQALPRQANPPRRSKNYKPSSTPSLHYYNTSGRTGHSDGRTPLQAYSARIKARPANPPSATHFRVRKTRSTHTAR